MKCCHDINLGRGDTRGLKRHQEIKLQKHSKKRWCGCTASTVLLWANKIGVCNPCRSTLRIFLVEHHLVFQLGDNCTKLFKLMFPDSFITKNFKGGLYHLLPKFEYIFEAVITFLPFHLC